MTVTTRRTTVFRAILAASAAATALTAVPAFAQAAADEENGNGEILVTAQFREQNLQDTPLSITAVDSALLESRNQTDLAQIAAQAPNVTLNAMGGAYGSSLGASIRGIGQFDFNPAYEPGVGMYIDDVYYATLTGGIFDLLDLERVEVLRGPQGTLTGRNSIGGAIKLFSKKPSQENEGSVEAVYGSRNRVDLRASMNFALSDALSARISGVYKRQNGYVDQLDYGCKFPGNALGIGASGGSGSNCVIDRLGEKNYSGIRGSVRYNPSDNFDLVLAADYTSEKRTNAAEVVTRVSATSWSVADPSYICGKFCNFASFKVPAGGNVTSPYEMPNTTDFSGYGFSANMTVGLSDSLNIQSITAYRNYRQKWGTDDDYTPSTTNIGAGYNDLRFKFFSQELRLNGKIGDNIDFTIGGFYSDQKSVYFTRQDIRYLAPFYSFLNSGLAGPPAGFLGAGPFFLQFEGNDPVNADSKAVFGTVIVRPTESMTLTGGLRYTDEHKDYTFSRRNWGGAPLTGFTLAQLGSLDGVKANYDGNRVDWRISADYRFSPAVLAYVTVGTGFKGGGVTARPFDAA